MRGIVYAMHSDTPKNTKRYHTFENMFGVFNIKIGQIRICTAHLSHKCSGKYIKTHRKQEMCLHCIRHGQDHEV